MKLKTILRRFLPDFYLYKKNSYSQSGEDLIIDFIFFTLGITNPTYLDIGAHHAFSLSNTAIFYKRGNTGVSVEPDPYLWKKLKKYRKNEKTLNFGIGLIDNVVEDFFIVNPPTLNSFSNTEIQKNILDGNCKLVEIKKIVTKTINTLISDNFEHCPNLISLDIEGMDYDVLKTFDFTKFRPDVFCIETLTFSNERKGVKKHNILELMKDKGYIIYADTFINTIFINQERWQKP